MNQKVIIFLAVFQGLCLGSDISFREQFNRQLLKKCNLADPSPEDQAKINLCHACAQAGALHQVPSLELFQAMKSVDIFELLSRQFQAGTEFGQRAVAEQCLYGFTDNIQDLLMYQKRIAYLGSQDVLAQRMINIIAGMTQAEQVFLKLFKPLDAQAKAEHDLIEGKLYFTFAWLKKCNENPYILGAISRVNASALVSNICNLAVVPIALKLKNDNSSDNIVSKVAHAIYGGIKEVHKTPEHMTQMYEPYFGHTAATLLTYQFLVMMGYQMYLSSKYAREIFDLVHEKQCDLLQVGHLIRSLQRLSKLIERDEQLKAFIPEHKKLEELFNPVSNKTSKDLKHLISQLLSSSFHGDSSYWLSNQGKILATHHLLCRMKGELVPYFEALGAIDAYLATYLLYSTMQTHQRVSYCFPEYVQSQSPRLIAHEFWHPLINADKVISNDLQMGVDNSNANLIITGPNAGGKTTSLMSLIINIICAQSFGIAPAKSLRLTPFAKIHSCLDITTNLQEGLSLFAAEVDRVKKHLPL